MSILVDLFFLLWFLSLYIRYELAQQLQNQSAEDPLEGTNEIQVEISDGSLQQAPTTTPEQQSILGLDQTEVVNDDQQVTLEAPLADQPLVQGEGTTCSSFFSVLVINNNCVSNA